jgi:hypothetical protein
MENPLRSQLTEIFKAALNANWTLVEPYFKEDALNHMRDRPFYVTREQISNACEKALEQVVQEHITGTFKPVLDQIAKDQARANLTKRLKARGLSMDLLDSIP